MAERSWTIREFAKGDEGSIVPLFERVFGRPMGSTESSEHWQWEFVRNPTPPLTVELVWDGDTLVGQYAISPRRTWFCGREQLGALSLDTMTHPDYGRQGIFSASAEACYARMVERGFGFVYGFPNASSIHGFEKYLRWKTIMPTPVHIKAIDVGGFVAGKLGQPKIAPWLSRASRLLSQAPTLVDGLADRVRSGAAPIANVHQFDAFLELEGVDDLWLRCRDQHRLWVVRDRAYASWRFDQRPESNYVRFAVEDERSELAGWAVVTIAEREQGRMCFLMDMVADVGVERATTSLLHAIERHARDQDCAAISAMVGPGSRHRSAFLRQAYLPLPERLFPQELYFGGRVLDPELDRAMLLHPESWQLGWADIDVL